MDIPKHQILIKSLTFLKSNSHAKMAPTHVMTGALPAAPAAMPRPDRVWISARGGHP